MIIKNTGEETLLRSDAAWKCDWCLRKYKTNASKVIITTDMEIDIELTLEEAFTLKEKLVKFLVGDTNVQ